MKPISRASQLYLGLVLFSMIGSFLQNHLSLKAEGIANVSSLLVLLTGIVAAVSQVYPARIWLSVLILGASAELIGLSTGSPFGQYEYTGLWWPSINLPHIGVFPLPLPFAWLLITACSAQIVQSLTSSRIGVAIGTGVLATFVDWAMESPMTQFFHYWTWKQASGWLHPNAPDQNFVGWALVSGVAGWVLGSVKAESNSYGKTVLLGHLALITVIAWNFENLVRGLFVAVGIVLLANNLRGKLHLSSSQ